MGNVAFTFSLYAITKAAKAAPVIHYSHSTKKLKDQKPSVGVKTFGHSKRWVHGDRWRLTSIPCATELPIIRKPGEDREKGIQNHIRKRGHTGESRWEFQFQDIDTSPFVRH